MVFGPGQIVALMDLADGAQCLRRVVDERRDAQLSAGVIESAARAGKRVHRICLVEVRRQIARQPLRWQMLRRASCQHAAHDHHLWCRVTGWIPGCGGRTEPPVDRTSARTDRESSLDQPPEGSRQVTRTIALEEHYWAPELASAPGTGILAIPGRGQRLDDRLRDLGELRIAEMDAAGIDLQVISHNTPAAQGLKPAESVIRSRSANDRLAAAVRDHPNRFAGFATLPTAEPAAAADELERAVTELGFVGAMVNSTLGSNGVFLDDARFETLLNRAERLDVPIYLHPALPPAGLAEILYRGLPEPAAMMVAGAAWGWHAEAGLHALRLVVTGVFERHPRLRLILGHCGEMIPFMLARMDNVLRPELTGRKPPSEYFLRHVWVTTSGMFALPPLRCTIDVFGIDRVLFSVDYPYSENASGRALLDRLGQLPLKLADQEKIAGGNAERLLGL